MKPLILRWLRLTSALALCSNFLGCAGTETTNPLKSFNGSDCKLHVLGSVADVSAVALTNDADAGADADAGTDAGTPSQVVVSCVSYEQTGDKLHLTAMNFGAACGIMSWQGDAHFEGDSLFVQSKNANPECKTAGCGSCIYDFEYDVSGAPVGKPIALSIEVGRCVDGDDLNAHTSKLQLPLDQNKSGTVCRDSAGNWKPR